MRLRLRLRLRLRVRVRVRVKVRPPVEAHLAGSGRGWSMMPEFTRPTLKGVAGP